MTFAFFAATNTGWNMAYHATTQQEAVQTLLELVAQQAKAVAHLGLEGMRTITLDVHTPSGVPVRFVSRLCPHTGNDWKVFVQAGLLADGREEARYPDPVSSVLALGAQAMAATLQE